MTKLTKAQLVDENITLRAQYEVLLTKYEAARTTNAALKAQLMAPVPAQAAPAPAADAIDEVLYEELISGGMPRKFAYGREVMPSQKQLAYWVNRVLFA